MSAILNSATSSGTAAERRVASSILGTTFASSAANQAGNHESISNTIGTGDVSSPSQQQAGVSSLGIGVNAAGTGTISPSVGLAGISGGNLLTSNLSNASSSLWLRTLLGNNTSSPIARVAEIENTPGTVKGTADSLVQRRVLGSTAMNCIIEENNRLLLDDSSAASNIHSDKTWNNPLNSQLPVLLGRYTAKKRHDSDKEEV